MSSRFLACLCGSSRSFLFSLSFEPKADLSARMSGEDKGDVPQNTQDLTVFVQNLLQQMVEHRTVGRACWRVSAASVAASQLQPRARERWRVDHSRVPHAPVCAFHQLQQQRFQDMSDAIIQRSASAAVPTRAPPCWHALSAPCLPLAPAPSPCIAWVHSKRSSVLQQSWDTVCARTL